jgi:hypothetical protein
MMGAAEQRLTGREGFSAQIRRSSTSGSLVRQ